MSFIYNALQLSASLIALTTAEGSKQKRAGGGCGGDSSDSSDGGLADDGVCDDDDHDHDDDVYMLNLTRSVFALAGCPMGCLCAIICT